MTPVLNSSEAVLCLAGKWNLFSTSFSSIRAKYLNEKQYGIYKYFDGVAWFLLNK